MKLYFHPYSTFARRTLIYIKERGLSAELIPVDMASKEHKGDIYRKLNPYGRVPCLQDGSLTLFESAAILYYLEDKHPDAGLLPSDIRQRALCRMHIGLCDGEFGVPSTKVLLPKRFVPKAKWDMAKIVANEQIIERHLAITSRYLGDQDYLVNNAFSLADLAYMPFLEFLPLYDIEIPENISAWANRLLARDSAVATKPDH